MFFALHDLPRNIEHVNSVCLKLGIGRRDQRCHNRITVPDHTGPPGAIRHLSFWCVCVEKLFLSVYAESLSSLYSIAVHVLLHLHMYIFTNPRFALCTSGCERICVCCISFPRPPDAIFHSHWLGLSVLRINPLFPAVCLSDEMHSRCPSGGRRGRGGAPGSALQLLCGARGTFAVCCMGSH